MESIKTLRTQLENEKANFIAVHGSENWLITRNLVLNVLSGSADPNTVQQVRSIADVLVKKKQAPSPQLQQRTAS